MDTVLKVFHIQLEPLKIELAVSSYSNMISLVLANNLNQARIHLIRYTTDDKPLRKIKVHLTKSLSAAIQADLTAGYREVMLGMMQIWNWDSDDLESRF